MANDTIKITYEELKSRASTLRKLKSEHEAELKKMQGVQKTLSGVWEGDAYNAYVERQKQVNTVGNTLSTLLENFAQLMESSAELMKAEDKAAAAKIKNS